LYWNSDLIVGYVVNDEINDNSNNGIEIATTVKKSIPIRRIYEYDENY